MEKQFKEKQAMEKYFKEKQAMDVGEGQCTTAAAYQIGDSHRLHGLHGRKQQAAWLYGSKERCGRQCGSVVDRSSGGRASDCPIWVKSTTAQEGERLGPVWHLAPEEFTLFLA